MAKAWSWADYERRYGGRDRIGRRARVSRPGRDDGRVSDGAQPGAPAETVVPPAQLLSGASNRVPDPDATPVTKDMGAAKDMGGVAPSPAAAGEDLPVVAPPPPDEQPQPPISNTATAADPPGDTPADLGTSPPAANLSDDGTREHLGADATHVMVLIPVALAARLMPFAESRSWTLAELVHNLVEIELEGELIDITLDGQ